MRNKNTKENSHGEEVSHSSMRPIEDAEKQRIQTELNCGQKLRQNILCVNSLCI